ncbi:FUSC family protein [Pedobacter cryoconitis]|uniref:Uncharacterized membrane protein YgaE (UPF0421/DUF939 family) n=1 Tax=Pedobacter cryoconitis TaxID=188932 RepID=A0A7X0JAT4_9SPHI|nr:FUSC family protein [Pedobacter cryoconitis]MBB6502976.1 uncharacterized membrane protein YgaE (UPF0421/DUF939 family) [Pedobacter cryoconitis]
MLNSFVPSSTMFQYMLKCLIGAAICYGLYVGIPQYPFYWSLVSLVVVITPEHKNDLAYDRMKANVLGSVTGLALYFIPVNNLLLILAGIILVIYLGTVLNLQNAIRTALAALVIVLIQEETVKDWTVAFERVVCVITGCLIALLITIVFSKLKWKGLLTK